MLQAFLNIFRIPELRNRVLFTLGILAIYRMGFWVPILGVNQSVLADNADIATQGGTAFGRIVQFASVFSGGNLSQSTIFGLGIMPYITASIIFQLLQSVWPALQDLKKEGASGQQKINEWTRYATVFLCLFQGWMWLKYMQTADLVAPQFSQGGTNGFLFYVTGLSSLTAGSLLLMWLGEQIDKRGIGNGVSMILTAGILARMPHAIQWVVEHFNRSTTSADSSQIGLAGVLLLATGFVVVIAGAIIITVAQRRIPIQQAKLTRGRKVYGGQRHYLPLRVNHAGVMPIIFASSLMVFPSAIFEWLASRAADTSAGGGAGWWSTATGLLASNFQIGRYPYLVVEIMMIYFFSYFWTTVQFSPDEMSKQLKEHGSFIPGLRPGPRTAEYLETVMERITYVGAGFLAVIAVIPTFVNQQLGIPFFVSQFLGGTGLLIVVSVALDLVQRLEANLVMRNYAGFLAAGSDRTGPRIRSARG